jgi:hypothetical protein
LYGRDGKTRLVIGGKVDGYVWDEVRDSSIK